MRIAFYGSSLLSAYWNGAATYYRGMLKALSRLGHEVTFLEPDAFGRQEHRDIDPPVWAKVVVWSADETGLHQAVEHAGLADVVVKASGVGVFDDELVEQVFDAAGPDCIRIFWDVDAPATLAGLRERGGDPLRAALPELDAVFTYGGGDPVVRAYTEFGARACVPIYNALDPETHWRAGADPRFVADLAFLGNRLPDREARVEEFFLGAARARPDRRFVLGGAGWDDYPLPANVTYVGHVPTEDHNAFNSSPQAVLNVSRQAMADTGFSPATRVFEAAGAGACVVTDAWPGIDRFFEPAHEILVASSGRDVARILDAVSPEEFRAVGAAARNRVLKDHTYEQRARQVHELLAAMRTTSAQAGQRRRRP